MCMCINVYKLTKGHRQHNFEQDIKMFHRKVIYNCALKLDLKLFRKYAIFVGHVNTSPALKCKPFYQIK